MQGEKRGTHSNFSEVSESEKVRVIPNMQFFFKEPVDLKVLAIHLKINKIQK